MPAPPYLRVGVREHFPRANEHPAPVLDGSGPASHDPPQTLHLSVNPASLLVVQTDLWTDHNPCRALSTAIPVWLECRVIGNATLSMSQALRLPCRDTPMPSQGQSSRHAKLSNAASQSQPVDHNLYTSCCQRQTKFLSARICNYLLLRPGLDLRRVWTNALWDAPQITICNPASGSCLLTCALRAATIGDLGPPECPVTASALKISCASAHSICPMLHEGALDEDVSHRRRVHLRLLFRAH